MFADSNAALETVPVFYVFFAKSAAAVPVSHYSWSTIRLTLSYGNRVVLLTHPEVVAPLDVHPCLGRGDVIALARNSTALRHLESKLSHQYLKDDTAISRFMNRVRNVKRYFVMHEYMRRHRLAHGMLLDSDASMTSWVGDVLPWMRAQTPPCDSALMIPPSSRPLTVPTWSAWAGTSLLSLGVLNDFLRVITDIFHHPERVERWLKASPMGSAGLDMTCAPLERISSCWNDMRTTYIFATVADRLRWPTAGLKEFEAQHHIQLPRAAHDWHLCNLEELGFVNNHVEFMPPEGPLNTGLRELMTPGPWSLYRPNLTMKSSSSQQPTQQRLFWNGKPVRSMHFWKQKYTVLEVLPPRTYLTPGSCTVPDYQLAWYTKWWAKAAYLAGVAGKDKRARRRR